MFKKLVVPFVFGVIASSAHACIVNNSMTDRLRQIVVANGGFPVSDEQCAILKRNNLAISVDGSATVLAGVNIGWAVVHLQDVKSNIASDKVGTATNVDKSDMGSQDIADTQFYKALGAAISSLDWSVASQEVTKYRAAAR